MCGRGPLLLFFCPVYDPSCCFGLVSRDQTSTALPFSSLAAVSCLCCSHLLSLFFLVFPVSLGFLFFWPLRFSRSGNAATLARLTNVESSLSPQLGPAACRQLGSGGWKGPSVIVGTQGLEGRAVGRPGPAGDARLPPWCRVWRLVTMARWQDNNKVPPRSDRQLGENTARKGEQENHLHG